MSAATILTLAEFPLVYLATPYSKYPDGIECAFRDAAALAARLMLRGVKVYSPIAHTHPLAIYGEVDPLDHAIWMPFDEAMMTASAALLVAQMQGWRESYGINHEIQFFKAAGKPIFYLDTITMSVAQEPHGFRANPDSLEGSLPQSGLASPESKGAGE